MTGGNSAVRLGITGLGGRGMGLLQTLLEMDDVSVSALCDRQGERLRQATERIEETGREPPQHHTDHGTLVGREDVDGVVIATPWRHHIPMAIEAM
jgi:predicted dehydrogenase